MPGLLDHSPADILREVMVATLSLGTDPDDGDVWPVYASSEPDSPDNCITVFDTEGVKTGRLMVGGEVTEHHGIQIRVRSVDFPTGYAKARAIAVSLDEELYYDPVTMESSIYNVRCFNRTSGVLSLGKDVPNTKRNLFTINGLLSVRRTGTVD